MLALYGMFLIKDELEGGPKIVAPKVDLIQV